MDNIQHERHLGTNYTIQLPPTHRASLYQVYCTQPHESIRERRKKRTRYHLSAAEAADLPRHAKPRRPGSAIAPRRSSTPAPTPGGGRTRPRRGLPPMESEVSRGRSDVIDPPQRQSAEQVAVAPGRRRRVGLFEKARREGRRRIWGSKASERVGLGPRARRTGGVETRRGARRSGWCRRGRLTGEGRNEWTGRRGSRDRLTGPMRDHRTYHIFGPVWRKFNSIGNY